MAAATSATQVTLVTYDGRGRLKTRHLPEAAAPTTLNYNPDDTLSSESDARGAETICGYNK